MGKLIVFQNTLQWSGYKVVQKKVLSFNYTPPTLITNTFNLNSQSDSMKYLGITLTNYFSKLIQANFVPLIY